MYKEIFLNRVAKQPVQDCAHVVDSSGKASNAGLHERIMEGVDDTELRRDTYERLKAQGMDEDTLKLFQ